MTVNAVFHNVKNNATSTLASAVDDSVTVISLEAGGGAIFPAAPFDISIDSEILHCSLKATDTLTCTRGQQSTTAAAHGAATVVELRVTALAITELQDAVGVVENKVPYEIYIHFGSIEDEVIGG